MSNKRMEPIGLKSIHVSDGFWRRYADLIPEVAIPYQWDILNDRIEGHQEAACAISELRREKKAGTTAASFSLFGCDEMAGNRGV